MKQMILNSWQKKWNIVNDQSNVDYGIGNEIICSVVQKF